MGQEGYVAQHLIIYLGYNYDGFCGNHFMMAIIMTTLVFNMASLFNNMPTIINIMLITMINDETMGI